jgi:hypothetical protein
MQMSGEECNKVVCALTDNQETEWILLNEEPQLSTEALPSIAAVAVTN